MHRVSAFWYLAFKDLRRVEPEERAAVLEGGILRFRLAAGLDMVWRVSASRSDGSQSGLSDLHTAPYTPV